MKTGDLARLIDRSVLSVYNQAHQMGLVKSDHFKNSEASGCIKPGQRRGKEFEFKKGQTPWNKGKKLPGHTTPAMRRTQFKKGNRPHNAQPVSSMKLDKDGYLWEKIAEPNTWKQYHHLVWESDHGKVPKGMIVVFKSGADRYDFTSADLELITREENMRRNTIHRYPDELKDTMKLIGKLSKKVRNAKEQVARP